MANFPETAGWKSCILLSGGVQIPSDKTQWSELVSVPAGGAVDAFNHYVTSTAVSSYASARRSHTLLKIMQNTAGGDSLPSPVPHGFVACGLMTDGGKDYELLCHARSAAAAWQAASVATAQPHARFRDSAVVKWLTTALWHIDQAGQWPYDEALRPTQLGPSFRLAIQAALVASVLQNACHGPNAPASPPPCTIGLARWLGETLGGAVQVWASGLVAIALVAAYAQGVDYNNSPVDALERQECLQQLQAQYPQSVQAHAEASRWLRLAVAMNGVARPATPKLFGATDAEKTHTQLVLPILAQLCARFEHGALDDMSPYVGGG